MRMGAVSSFTVTLALLFSASGLLSVQAATFNDTDVLNFALNLECLEAEFYSWAAYGKGLASVDPTATGTNSNLTATSSGGASGVGTTGGAFSSSTTVSSTATAAALAYATEVAENEVHHVQFLRKALGSLAVACPSISVAPTTFTTAAAAAVKNAGLTLASSTDPAAFNPYAILGHFWLAAYIFEDVGVTAYKGAVSVLADASLAATASGIGSVEAGHAAVVRDALYALRTTNTGLTLADGTPVTYGTAVTAINKLRDTLGGTNTVESPLTRTATAYANAPTGADQPMLFAVDSNAVAYTRTPKQVANIVYFSSATTPGGFYPFGVNANSALISGSAANHRCVASS